jgi:acyl-CoA synthetase (AMP-forming)/AMP-acid ligase II
MTIGDLLDEQARLRPDTPALIDVGAVRTLTFAQLDREVTAAAAAWQAEGLQRGDAVLVFVPMSADLYVALLGLFRFGGVALFLDPSAAANTSRHVVRVGRRTPCSRFPRRTSCGCGRRRCVASHARSPAAAGFP